MTERLPRSGIIGWFAANPVAANLLMLLVILIGAMEVGNLRKEAFPSREPDSLTITVSYDSGSARLSEEGLAIKIEERLEDVDGIRSVNSESNRSGVTVTVEKQSDYDLDTLLRDVKNRVDAISTFPTEAKNPVIRKAQREEHALWIQLYGDADRHTLQQIAENLKTDLLAAERINRVKISGWLDPMMAIEIDEGQLQAYDLSISDVEAAINNNSSTTLTAVMRNQDFFLQLQASDQAYTKRDFAEIPLINSPQGQQVRLGDVADVRDMFDDLTSVLSRYQGHDSIALQVITTGKDDIANTVESARQVANEWQNAGKLPAGVEMATWYDRSTHIMERLNLLFKNAVYGIALVFVLLALFLNLTVAFWVAMGLPFVYFGSLFLLGDQFAGLSLNPFTTFGFLMALGIIVDDAVVVGESIYSVRQREGDTLRNTIKGTMRVAVPTLFGVFTTVAAFAALSQLEGRLGQLYAQFATVVAIALVFSIIESKLILPAHLAHLKTHRPPIRNRLLQSWQSLQNLADSGLQWFAERLYRPLLESAIRFRYAALLLFIAIFIGVITMPFTGAVKMSFFPSIPGETIRASLSMQKDVSYGQTHENLRIMEEKAYATDKALRGDDEASGIDHLQILSDSAQWGQIRIELKKDAPYALSTFSRQWQDDIGMPEGVRNLSVRSYYQMADDLRVELRSNDDEVLKQAGQQIKDTLAQIPAVLSLEDNLQPGQPQLELELNQQGRALGLNTDDLARQVLQSFNGQVVQRYQRGSDEIEVKVRLPEADRQNPADVLSSRVRLDDNTVIPLSSVATVSDGYSRETISRIDGRRSVFISADLDKRVQSSTELVEQLDRQLVPELLQQYPGLSIHFAGEAEEQAETESSMFKLFILAMVVIFTLLAVPLKSYIQPLLIMTAIPFGVVGAILGHWMNDLSLGILSFNGIIALSGVVVNDSLLLVSRFNGLKSEHHNWQEDIQLAARDRLRAVLLTSVTTFAGLYPLLSETSLQAQFLIPAAVSLGYGIMFATVITLILIPVLLTIQLDVRRLLQREDTIAERAAESRS